MPMFRHNSIACDLFENTYLVHPIQCLSCRPRPMIAALLRHRVQQILSTGLVTENGGNSQLMPVYKSKNRSGSVRWDACLVLPVHPGAVYRTRAQECENFLTFWHGNIWHTAGFLGNVSDGTERETLVALTGIETAPRQFSSVPTSVR